MTRGVERVALGRLRRLRRAELPVDTVGFPGHCTSSTTPKEWFLWDIPWSASQGHGICP